MPISSVGQSSYQPYSGVSQVAKPDPQEASSAPANSTSAEATAAKSSATAQSKDTTPDGDDAKSASSSAKGSSAPNMYKINPDGTIGPLHLPRPGHAPGVVHA